jgi:hypothetical protein
MNLNHALGIEIIGQMGREVLLLQRKVSSKDLNGPRFNVFPDYPGFAFKIGFVSSYCRNSKSLACLPYPV